MGSGHSENLMKSPLIAVFHISIWRNAPRGDGSVLLPLCCHYWKTCKMLQSPNQVRLNRAQQTI